MEVTGTYKTQHGDLILRKEGDTYFGTYQADGTTEGKLAGNVMEGKWHNKKDGGIFKWTFDGQGNFTGAYKVGEEPGAMRGKWNGSLVTEEGSGTLSESLAPVQHEEPIQKEESPVTVKENTSVSTSPAPDEKGRWTDSEGTVFEGKWVDGQMVSGKFTTTDGDVADGEFKNMELHGKGRYSYTETIEADPEDPESEAFDSHTVMKGDWVDGKMISGKIIVDDELYEEGQFDEDGELHGKGKRIHGEDEYEEGIFENGDLQEGKVRLSDEDGDIYEGEYSNGARNGEGKYVGEDGSVYVGFFNNNEFAGEGKYTEANGDWMQGIFENGEFMEGRVLLTFEDGSSYKGEMMDGQRTGRGTYTFASGDRYEGEFVEGNYSGKGRYTYADGDFKDGLWAEDEFIEGQVKITSEDRVYEGGMKGSDYAGQGKLVYGDGDMYEGEFEDGFKHGKGKYTRANGTFREGLFQNDEFVSGRILAKFSGGGGYEGEILNDEYHGKGKYTSSGGTSYDGEWKHGEYHGKGEWQSPTGDRKDGKWEEGQFISGNVKITYDDGSWYDGDWEENRPEGYGRWENPKTGEFKDGMWDADGFYSGEMRLLVNGKLEDLDGMDYFLENAWAKEKERLRIEEEKAARIAAAKEEERRKVEREREKVAAAAAKEREKADKAREKAQASKEKERLKADKIREADRKKADIEKRKRDAEKEKTRTRTFKIDYKIKLTKAKSSTQYKGAEFGMIGIVLSGAKTKQVKTHDKGETIQRSIRVQHSGQTIPAKLVKHYIETNDSDVKAGRAGTSTIVVLNVREA